MWLCNWWPISVPFLIRSARRINEHRECNRSACVGGSKVKQNIAEQKKAATFCVSPEINTTITNYLAPFSILSLYLNLLWGSFPQICHTPKNVANPKQQFFTVIFPQNVAINTRFCLIFATSHQFPKNKTEIYWKTRILKNRIKWVFRLHSKGGMKFGVLAFSLLILHIRRPISVS